MKNQRIIAILLLTTMIIVAAAPLCAAASLSKPSVTLPSNWEIYDETAYPNAVSEHDNAGAGLVEYENSVTYDYVMVYYENAPSTAYTSASLKTEVVDIFNRDHEDLTITESGTKTVAGVQAGFAKSYSETYDTYFLELVFVKGNYYINAYAVYYADNENDVFALLNSINTDASIFSGSNLLIIIGIVVAIVVVVVVVLFMMRRKKSTQPMQAAAPVNFPPPPPT